MEFSVKEDVEGTQKEVFDALGDLEAIERAAMRRGVEISRTDPPGGPGEGSTWAVRFRYRGRMRDAEITLTEYAPPQRMACLAHSGGLDVRTVLDVVALSRTRTRIAADTVLMPRTLSARLLVQSLKLARSSITKRIKARSTEFARDLETRIRRAG